MKRTILIKIVFRQFYGWSPFPLLSFFRFFMLCRVQKAIGFCCFSKPLAFVLIASYCFSIIFMPSSTACMLSGMRP